MRSAPRLAAGIICVALTTAAMAQQTPRRFEATARGYYFLEFRARGGGILGHTFVVYGRKDGAGRTVEEYHAGLNPDDAWGDSPVLAVALVQGEDHAQARGSAQARRRGLPPQTQRGRVRASQAHRAAAEARRAPLAHVVLQLQRLRRAGRARDGHGDAAAVGAARHIRERAARDQRPVTARVNPTATARLHARRTARQCPQMRRRDWGQAMRSAPFLFALFAALSFDAPARAQDAGRHNHFIDFRSRPGALVGPHLHPVRPHRRARPGRRTASRRSLSRRRAGRADLRRLAAGARDGARRCPTTAPKRRTRSTGAG